MSPKIFYEIQVKRRFRFHDVLENAEYIKQKETSLNTVRSEVWTIW